MLKPNVTVSVKTHFMRSESRPEKKRFVYSYTITIKNDGELAAQLISRHWIITSGETLKTQEVSGDGVIGQQPNIQPGEHFTYTSGTVMDSAVGIMQGSYRMLDAQGEYFDVVIEPFTLAVPNQLN
ncbi:Co2+/Mg2+ efflux protein ApaG [Bermanella sp. 47_1433_sub80_T6]|nr:Co2+/Mg2+ efflux protein ApaG [Bermanella sp. 47_1433_sub80_T6]